MKEIYLDNAAATPIGASVRKEMLRAMTFAGNPSSYNDAGRKAADELAKARRSVARFLGAHENEIVFTGSGSEANNLALRGAAFAHRVGKTDILTTPIEHLSVLEPANSLARAGKRTVFIKVDADGLADPEGLAGKITSKTLLVSVMYANNEVGTIEPVAKIGKIIRGFRKIHNTEFPLFHTDACQAAEYLDMNVNRLQVDLLTFNGSKIYGPRGIGVLYVRQGTAVARQTLGGGQEFGLRAGTENLPAILGLAKAVAQIDPKEGERLIKLRDYFFSRLMTVLPDARVNGAVGKERLPNNINISIPGLDSENLLLELDKYGIRAGSGSACTARSVEPSHVLKAMGVAKPYLDGALRFSLGRQTTKRDIDAVLATLPVVVNDLRKRYS